MQIHNLHIHGYRGRLDWEWGKSFLNPSWLEVEAAVRRLDANEYAGLSLQLSGVYDDGGEQPSFHITGGGGQYLVSYSGGGGSRVHYVDPTKPDLDELVEVVRRDQGVWVPAHWVCTDVELVAAIARYFVETSRPYPGVAWG
jgi:hypothetical protein